MAKKSSKPAPKRSKTAGKSQWVGGSGPREPVIDLTAPPPVEEEPPITAKTLAVSPRMTLKDIRKNVFGLTIEQFAGVLGTTRSTYFFWEKGDRPKGGALPAKFHDALQRALKDRGIGQVEIIKPGEEEGGGEGDSEA